jgi:hypothetical protein
MARSFRHSWPFIRDLVLFAVGVAGILHETLIGKTDRPNLLILFGVLVGAPLFTRDGPKR